MRAHMTWLDEAEKQTFVDEALGILERVGVELKGSAALPVLADLGADVDPQTGVVRLPADLVRRSVEACPRRVLFAGASPEHDVVLDEGEPAHFCSSGCAAFVLDHETGVRRPSTLTDLQAATILLDEVPEVDVHVDHDHGRRRARRGPRAGRLLRGAHRGPQARHARRQPVAGRAAAAHHGHRLRRPRGVPRAAAVQHAAHRGVAAAHRRAAARLPRGHRRAAARRSRSTRCPWPGPRRR